MNTRRRRQDKLLRVAADKDLQALARAFRDHAAQIVEPRDRLAVDAQNPVTGQEAGLFGRAVRLHRGDERQQPRASDRPE